MSTRSGAYEAGIKVRTEVLGAAHVGRSAVPEDDFSAPMQQFVTEVGWGNIWSRGGLDRKSRSMITVAMLAAIGSDHESTSAAPSTTAFPERNCKRSCFRLGCMPARPRPSRRSVSLKQPCSPSAPAQLSPIRRPPRRESAESPGRHVQEKERTANAAGNDAYTGNRHKESRLGRHDRNHHRLVRFVIYSQAAALVFGPLFFPALRPALGTLAGFATFGIGFVARPIGAAIFGHFGDRVGRKTTLVTTLTLMGLATLGVGFLPTYAQVGLWAPCMLVALRLIQGFAVGGEWGGAVLMAVEHAPSNRRGFYGSWPQLGTPLSLIIATLVMTLLSASMGNNAFLA